MAKENEKVYKFNREYTGHLPVSYDPGPGTFILDTIVLPVYRGEDVEDNGRIIQR